MSNFGCDLDDIVRSYLSTHDIYKQNSYRNTILLSVINTGTSNFIQILNNIYDEGDDPVDRKNVLNLLHEVVSRTENIFDSGPVLDLLLKCLKLTICVQLSLATMRAVIERHSNPGAPTYYKDVQQFHDSVSLKKISEYPQKCRMDYLVISDHLVDLFTSGKINKINLRLICDEISGERDPRNILVMFDLLSKLARNVAKAPEDFECISRTISVYYPIQFEPPENDTIKITPLQLKKSLLACFISSDQLGPYSMETLIDSLCSEFSLSLNYTSVISDTLYFLRACKPVYQACFNNFVGQLVQIMKLELLDENKKIPEESGEPCSAFELPYDGEDSEDIDQLTIPKVVEVGSKYYRKWNYVDEKIQLFGEILRLFVEIIHTVEEELLNEFLKLIAGNIYSNNSIGYLVDIMCENHKAHSKVIEFIIVPVLRNVIINENNTPHDVNNVLNILVMFIMPKILMNCKSQTSNTKLIQYLLYLIDPKESKLNNILQVDVVIQRNVQYLKLLTLSSCIIDNKIADHLTSFIIDKIFQSPHNIFLNDIHDEVDEMVTVNNKDLEELYYLECLICMYKCHNERNLKILTFLNNICSKVVESESDFHKSLLRISYLRRSGKQINILNKMCELFKAVLEHSSDNSSDNSLLERLVTNILKISFKALKCLIDSKSVRSLNSLEVVPGSDVFIPYSSLIPCAFEHWKSLILNLYSREQLLEDLKNLIHLYKESFYNDEKNIIRLVFLTSSVPRIIKHLSEVVELDVGTVLDEDFRFLNIYMNKCNKLKRLKSFQIELDSCGNGNELSFPNTMELMNLEAELICNGYFNNFENLSSFVYFNGSLLVKYVLNKYPFDINTLLKPIKVVDNYKLKNFDYEDLFLVILPISINRVKPIIKHQIIDVRNIKRSSNENNDLVRDEQLYEFLMSRLRDDICDLVPNYQEILFNPFSKIELYISLISLLINKGFESIEAKSMDVIIKDVREILNIFKEIRANNRGYGNEKNNFEWDLTAEYVHWCFDKYLILLQELLYGIFTTHSSKENKVFNQFFKGDLEEILEDLISVYEVNQVPFSRILTILIINSVIKMESVPIDAKEKVKFSIDIIALVN
eukprot:XP_766473.1 hypothetical protein [Theileria parva strain Muguga]